MSNATDTQMQRAGNAGVRARRNLLPLYCNPFHESDLAWAWEMGWKEEEFVLTATARSNSTN